MSLTSLYYLADKLRRGLILGLICVCSYDSGAGTFFPYPYTVDDLTNGLRVVTLPSGHPNLVAFYLVVETGSRNEVEVGRTGFAHFFEHMMFRGSENFTPEQREAIFKRAGAAANAYTSSDRTVYHQTFAKEDLEKIVQVEADRFQRLRYSREAFRTEALAVLGEYNKNSADPAVKLEEVVFSTAFTTHTYRHTTMGFIQDIEDMPNQYEYSLEFYHRYYRPEHTTILLVGDVSQDRALPLIQHYFGSWPRVEYRPTIPREPEQTQSRSAHIDWPTPSLPLISISYHGPAYSDTKKEKAALDLLGSIVFGETSELYRKLVLVEQKVESLAVDFGDTIDPSLFTVFVRVKNMSDVPNVKDEILATIKRYSRELVEKQKLDDIRSRYRYGTVLGLDSADAIAGFLAPYLALRRTPETIERLFAVIDKLTPDDLRAAAAQYLREENQTIVTLTAKP
jgi:zinc protease